MIICRIFTWITCLCVQQVSIPAELVLRPFPYGLDSNFEWIMAWQINDKSGGHKFNQLSYVYLSVCVRGALINVYDTTNHHFHYNLYAKQHHQCINEIIYHQAFKISSQRRRLRRPGPPWGPRRAGSWRPPRRPPWRRWARSTCRRPPQIRTPWTNPRSSWGSPSRGGRRPTSSPRATWQDCPHPEW